MSLRSQIRSSDIFSLFLLVSSIFWKTLDQQRLKHKITMMGMRQLTHDLSPLCKLTNNKKFAKIGVIIIIITLWDKIFRIEKNVDV